MNIFFYNQWTDRNSFSQEFKFISLAYYNINTYHSEQFTIVFAFMGLEMNIVFHRD